MHTPHFHGVYRVGRNSLTGDRLSENVFSCFSGDLQIILMIKGKAKKVSMNQRQQYNYLQGDMPDET